MAIIAFLIFILLAFVAGVFVGKKHAAKIQRELDDAQDEIDRWRASASAVSEAAEKAADAIKSNF